MLKAVASEVAGFKGLPNCPMNGAALALKWPYLSLPFMSLSLFSFQLTFFFPTLFFFSWVIKLRGNPQQVFMGTLKFKPSAVLNTTLKIVVS